MSEGARSERIRRLVARYRRCELVLNWELPRLPPTQDRLRPLEVCLPPIPDHTLLASIADTGSNRDPQDDIHSQRNLQYPLLDIHQALPTSPFHEPYHPLFLALARLRPILHATALIPA